ncbi:hypothetical protein V1477_020546 [Vespula maculifrons]|uniref:Uncharacterized protein n=1 Tax=Vespula maculifrons TaxID=7453 RepID=A0ABD2AM75_VESMC
MDFGSINEVRKGRLLKLCDIDQSYRLYLIFPGILKRKFYELTEGLCNVRKGCYDRGNNGKLNAGPSCFKICRGSRAMTIYIHMRRSCILYCKKLVILWSLLVTNSGGSCFLHRRKKNDIFIRKVEIRGYALHNNLEYLIEK